MPKTAHVRAVVPECEAVAVQIQNLDLVPVAPDEDKQMTGQRMLCQQRLDQIGHAID
jgi:hypothetical protein